MGALLNCQPRGWEQRGKKYQVPGPGSSSRDPAGAVSLCCPRMFNTGNTSSWFPAVEVWSSLRYTGQKPGGLQLSPLFCEEAGEKCNVFKVGP